MRYARTQRGFTLLELTLALSVAAILALTLYRSMTVCLRARRTAINSVQPVRAATIAMDLISRDLESVVPPNGILAGPFIGTRQTQSNAESDFLEFCSVGSDGDGTLFSEGIRRVELGLRTDVVPPVLVRRVTRNLLARTEVEPEEEILCRHVLSMSLRYYDGLNWLEEWDSTVLGDVLPFAVEVNLAIGESAPSLTDQAINRIVRIIPLACARLADDVATDASTASSTGGTGTSSGGTSGQSGGTGGRP